MPKAPPAKPQTALTEALHRSGAQIKRKRTKPLWRGPQIDGITQSLLSRFLVCPERFRILTVEGLRPDDGFNVRLEYGSMWHVCEEWFAREPAKDTWKDKLLEYCQGLAKEHKTAAASIKHWYKLCLLQFPVYMKWWEKTERKEKRKHVLAEVAFRVPYTLPSGRYVTLRGKWDRFDLTAKATQLLLQENKTKGDVREGQLLKQLTFDLQTMIYIVAAQRLAHGIHPADAFIEPWPIPKGLEKPVWGVLYNVVRRPLSGGKYNFKQLKATAKKPAETDDDYYARIGEAIAGDPGYFFIRYTVGLSTQDITRFQTDFLDPILERLCDWWEWIEKHPFTPFDPGNKVHFRTPYGFYNILAEGGSGALDEYIATGNDVGLTQSKTLFRELET